MNLFRKSAVALAGLWLAVAATAAGQDPVRISGTTTVPRDSLVVLSVEAAGDTSVTWRITPSANVTKAPKQPAGQLVFNAPPGKYQVDTLVIDWQKKTVVEATETVTIGDAKTPPPGGTDPPPPTTGAKFFVIVRAAQADDTFRGIMALPAWAELKAAGHTFKDYTPSTVPAGVVVPSGVTLPFVLTLDAVAGGWKQAPGNVPLPTTNDGVRSLKGGAP